MTYECRFIFYGDDHPGALANRIRAALEIEELDYDPESIEINAVPESEAT